MARTPLLSRFEKLSRQVALTAEPRNTNRRTFLKSAALGIGALAAARLSSASPKPKIVIVGAGIAGLNAALTLSDNGFPSTIYEASGRIGGRMHSDTSSWLNGQVTEHCGELIDSGHATILSLAGRFQIPLIDVQAAQPAGSDETYFFDGHYYPLAQAEKDFLPVYQKLQDDANAAGYPTLYNSFSPAGFALDQTSVHHWIAKNVPGGHKSRLGQLLEVAYNIEYGADTRLQSSLNLVYLLGFQNDPHHFTLFGQSDEHYRLQGGNERLPRAIAAALPSDCIHLDSPLRSIAKRHDGTYRLSFGDGNKFEEVEADHVILTLPFSVLRKLDYHRAGFNAVKTIAIEELGYGCNAKLHLQFDDRLWNQSGPWGVSTGTTYADTGFQNVWESSRGQDGATGILVNYLGSGGAQFAGEPRNAQAIHAHAKHFLAELEPVFPGISAQWNGRATLDTPGLHPFTLGSYSFWKVGQYTLFSGAEAEPSGNCHFAGEHCSTDFQGFMEGAAAEGARAANEIIMN